MVQALRFLPCPNAPGKRLGLPFRSVFFHCDECEVRGKKAGWLGWLLSRLLCGDYTPITIIIVFVFVAAGDGVDYSAVAS